jgi:YD repeat-containing protein
MKKTIVTLCLLAFALPLTAQQREAAAARRNSGAGTAAQPDVLVDVPNLSVEDIRLDVQNVRVRVALDARVANLLVLNAGADASIDRVRLQISGVRAEARLVVRLDKVARILDRTLLTIDNNPKLITNLLTAVDTTVNTVGGVANTALQPGGVVSQAVGTVGQTLNSVTAPGGLLTQTVNALGQTVQRTLDTTGNLVERTLDTAGGVVSERTVGRLLDLPVVSQTTNAAGQAVKQVRDTTGAVLEYTLDASGKVVGSRVVSAAPRR